MSSAALTAETPRRGVTGDQQVSARITDEDDELDRSGRGVATTRAQER
jgi:hypothetical protein